MLSAAAGRLASRVPSRRASIASAAVLVVITLGALWLRTARLLPPDPAFFLPADHHIYAFMASHPIGEFHIAPWCWRILGPALAAGSGLRVDRAFEVITFLSLAATALLMFFILRRLRIDLHLSLLGVLLLMSLGYATKFNIYDFWLSDPLAFAFTAAAFLFVLLRWDVPFAICLAVGVLAKESVLFAVALHYGMRARQPIDARAALNTATLALPALAVLILVRAAIPAWNGRQDYVAMLPYPIRRNARTIPSYDVSTVLSLTIQRRHLGETLVRTLTAFGAVVPVLAIVGVYSARRFAARLAPFVILVLSQLLFAQNTQRLLVLAFPALIVLAAFGLRWLRDERGVGSSVLTCLAVGTFGLGLLSRTEWMPNAAVQVAWLAAMVAFMLYRTNRGTAGSTERIRAEELGLTSLRRERPSRPRPKEGEG